MKRHLVTVVIAFGLIALPALASVDEAQIHVEGLACPFCVYGVEKNLKRVPGVVSLLTTIRTGWVHIDMEPNAVLDTDALKEAIKKAGFTPSDIEATVTGDLIQRDERWALKSTGTGQVFLLVEPSEDGLQRISEETLAKLQQASNDGAKPVVITGLVHSHPGMPPALAVERFKVAS